MYRHKYKYKYKSKYKSEYRCKYRCEHRHKHKYKRKSCDLKSHLEAVLGRFRGHLDTISGQGA